MRLFAAVLAVAVALAFAPFVQAGPKGLKAGGTPHHHPITGKVVKVSGTTLTIQVTNKKGQTKDRLIKTDDKTKILLDGKTSSLADLKAGETVEVTIEHHVATEIAAVTSSGKSGAGAASTGASAS